MPVLTVFGIPPRIPYMGEAHIAIVKAVVSVKELGLRESDVSIFYPKDALGEDWDEIVVFVEGLFEKPERTEEVKNRLAEVICNAIADQCPNAKVIECFVRSFNPKSGFFTIRRSN